MLNIILCLLFDIFILGPRYKRWKLFNRKPDIPLPQIVRSVNLIDAYEAARCFRAGEENQYNLTAIGCSFAPDDAGTLGTVGTFPYYLNNEERFRVPCGYVSMWDVHEDECEHNGIIFTYAVQPSPTFSQCGNVFCAVMNSFHGQLLVIGYDIEDDNKYFDAVPLSFTGGNLCGKTLFASVNHDYAVTLTNMKMQNDLDICNFAVWKVKENIIFKHRGMKKVADIVGHSVLGMFLCDASFSPDSKYFGLLISNDYFLLVNIFTKNCERINKLGALLECSVKSFCFDPKFRHEIIAIASEDNVYIVDVIVDDFAPITISIPTQEQISGVKHVTFSKDGNSLGICAGNGNALIYSSHKHYCLIHVLCPSGCREAVPNVFNLVNLCANRIAFSSSSEEVCIAYNNGYVCVWQLPRKLKLKDICRLKILCLYPMDFIESLDIPKKLKGFLKFEAIFS